MSRRLLQVLRVLWLAMVLLSVPYVAHSQVKAATKEELAAARQLFIDAMKLEKQDEWKPALKNLQKVGQVKMTPQVRFHIALCHEHLGNMVEAINGFELAVQEAEAAGDKATDVVENAPPRAAALRARVAHVRLRVAGTVRSSKFFIDGKEVSLALIDTEIPIDPGEHTVEVRRAGEVTHDHSFRVGESESELVDFEVDDPELPDPVPDPDPKPNPDPNGDRAGPVEDESKRIPAYVAAGVGVLALVGAAVTFGLRESSLSNVRCQDPDNFKGCDPDDEETVNLAESYDVASKVLLGVGAAAVAAGVVLWFVLEPNDGSPSSGVGVAPTIGGLQISGRF
jgi:hypothetical protein